MATRLTAASMTVEEYAELPDDGTLQELVRGEVVTLPRPNYQHGFLTAKVTVALDRVVQERDLGEVVADERLDASDVVAGWSPLVRELLE